MISLADVVNRLFVSVILWIYNILGDKENKLEDKLPHFHSQDGQWNIHAGGEQDSDSE